MIRQLISVLSLTWIVGLYSYLYSSVSNYTHPFQGNTPSAVSLHRTGGVAVDLAKEMVLQVHLSVKTASQSAIVDSLVEPTRLEISLSQRRVTFFSDGQPVDRYAIAVGRAGWETPQGKFRVKQMLQNPKWINPLTDEVIPGGDPDNPLGGYWIGFWTDGRNWIGFHGTPNPESVGRAVSHGCIRMYNQDIEEVFYQVTPGTQVIVKR